MLRRLVLALLALNFASVAYGQAWTTAPRTPAWVANPTVGDGSTTWGGTPPAFAYQPSPIENAAGYDRSKWIIGAAESYVDGGEAKFRITCNFSHFGQFDPILFFGQANAGHHHTFIGNKNTGPSSTFQTLRNSPASTCSGGPLNGTAYWEPTLFGKTPSGAFAPIKPNVVSFYYTHALTKGAKKVRLPRGLAFIGGVNPADFDNTSRNAEIPAGQGWMPAYDGFRGWACYNGGTNIPVATGPYAGQSHARQLKNADGSDPWGGNCVAGLTLIAEMNAPDCWDGHNLTSPNGRDHFRYSIKPSSNQSLSLCPNGWWSVPVFEVKTEFSHNGWADYQHWYLSSDRMDPNPANWRPNGSTFHFDWMNGWEDQTLERWHSQCNGVTTATGGTPVEKTCGSSTISANERMRGGMINEFPEAGQESFSNSPIISFPTYHDDPPTERYGAVVSGSTHDNVTLQSKH